MPEARFMRVAIDAARLGLSLVNHPYGVAIVRGDEVICGVNNIVPGSVDATAHSEVSAIHWANF